MSKNIDKKSNGRKNYKEKAKLNNTVIGGGIGIDSLLDIFELIFDILGEILDGIFD